MSKLKELKSFAASKDISRKSANVTYDDAIVIRDAVSAAIETIKATNVIAADNDNLDNLELHITAYNVMAHVNTALEATEDMVKLAKNIRDEADEAWMDAFDAYQVELCSTQGISVKLKNS